MNGIGREKKGVALGESASAIAPSSASPMPLPGTPAKSDRQQPTHKLQGFSARVRAYRRPLRRPGYLGMYLRGRDR